MTIMKGTRILFSRSNIIEKIFYTFILFNSSVVKNQGLSTHMNAKKDMFCKVIYAKQYFAQHFVFAREIIIIVILQFFSIIIKVVGYTCLVCMSKFVFFSGSTCKFLDACHFYEGNPAPSVFEYHSRIVVSQCSQLGQIGNTKMHNPFSLLMVIDGLMHHFKKFVEQNGQSDRYELV